MERSMSRIDLKTLANGLRGRDRPDFGPVRPRVQIPGPRPISEFRSDSLSEVLVKTSLYHCSSSAVVSIDDNQTRCGEAAAAVVLMNGLLTKWLLAFPPFVAGLRPHPPFATAALRQVRQHNRGGVAEGRPSVS